VLEVEVARGQTLYRQTFSRGLPLTKLETVGKVANRRGTRVRFKPDAQIFGRSAHFVAARLFKMARSKAYLFGGVEIRWSCAPSLLKGVDDVPAEAVLRFPGGLKDYLAARSRARTVVAEQIFSGKITKERRPWLARMGDRLARTMRDGFSSSYCNTIPTPEGGTHEPACASRCCAACATMPSASASPSAWPSLPTT
jgi:topoisomerase-4 subunit B